MPAEQIWRGEASPPMELADEVAKAKSVTMRLPYVEPLETVTITMSAANRDLVVAALRRFGGN